MDENCPAVWGPSALLLWSPAAEHLTMQQLEPGGLLLALAGIGVAAVAAVALGRGIARMFFAASSAAGDDQDL